MYKFTQNWFKEDVKIKWEELFLKHNFQNCLELGSFEGKSSTFLIEHNISELHCVDRWNSTIHIQAERLFDLNTSIALDNSNVKLYKYKMPTINFLTSHFEKFQNYFDFIYIDASHEPKDVVSDGNLSFYMLKKGGFMIFDDYDSKHNLKLYIDHFCELFKNELDIHDKDYQLYLKKH